MPAEKKSDRSGQRGRADARVSASPQKDVARPEAGLRAWPTGKPRDGAGRKIAAGRKVPFGAVGGLGRKTNLSRSS